MDMDGQSLQDGDPIDSQKITGHSARPEDFSFRFDYQEGSVPSEYYYEYTIEVANDGSGEIRYLPDHPQNHPDELVELFDVSSADMDRLYLVLKLSGLLHPTWQPSRTGRLGGPRTRLEIIAGGRMFELHMSVSAGDADQLEKLYDIIRATVPENIWEKIGQMR